MKTLRRKSARAQLDRTIAAISTAESQQAADIALKQAIFTAQEWLATHTRQDKRQDHTLIIGRRIVHAYATTNSPKQ